MPTWWDEGRWVAEALWCSVRLLLTFWLEGRSPASGPGLTVGNWNHGKQNCGKWNHGYSGEYCSENTRSLFSLFQTSKKSVIYLSFNVCFPILGNSRPWCWGQSPRGLEVLNLRWRRKPTLLPNEGAGVVAQKRLDYMEGNHCILLCATEKVWALLGWARRGTTAAWPLLRLLCKYGACCHYGWANAPGSTLQRVVFEC